MTKPIQPFSHDDRSALATIVVVTPDLTLLKLVDMALKLELACEVLGFTSARSAEETMRSVTPDLVILDEQALDGYAHHLADRLHGTEGSSPVPTLFLNSLEAAQRPNDHTISLGSPWKVEALYAAAHHLLGHTPETGRTREHPGA